MGDPFSFPSKNTLARGAVAASPATLRCPAPPCACAAVQSGVNLVGELLQFGLSSAVKFTSDLIIEQAEAEQDSDDEGEGGDPMQDAALSVFRVTARAMEEQVNTFSVQDSMLLAQVFKLLHTHDDKRISGVDAITVGQAVIKLVKLLGDGADLAALDEDAIPVRSCRPRPRPQPVHTPGLCSTQRSAKLKRGQSGRGKEAVWRELRPTHARRCSDAQIDATLHEAMAIACEAGPPPVPRAHKHGAGPSKQQAADTTRPRTGLLCGNESSCLSSQTGARLVAPVVVAR